MSIYFRLREGWLMVGLVTLLLFSVIWSVQRANWSDSLFILTPITLAGIVTGLVLCKVRGVPRLLLHLTGTMAGVALVLWETANLLDDPDLLTIQDRVQNLLLRAANWMGTILDGGVSDDLPLFILSLAVLAWILAYGSIWFVFRSRWLWWALVPNGVALLVNISYSSAQLGWYFILFMLSALLLMVRFNMLLHEERWERERVNYSPSLRWNFLWASTVFAVVVAGVMWYMPSQAVNSTLSSAWEKINGPWEELQQRWSKAFANVPGSGNFGYATFNDSFVLGGPLNLGAGIVLKVKSDDPLYWRAKTADTYDGRGWKSTAADTFRGRNLSSRLSLGANQQLQTNDSMVRPVTVTVQLVHPRDNIIFAPFRPESIDVPTQLVVSWQELNQIYEIPGSDPQTAPIELQPLLRLFADARMEALIAYGRDPQNPVVGGQALPPGGAEEIAQAVLARTGQEAAIHTQIDQLRDRGIVASYWLRKDFTFMVRANGPIPIYDDLTAVYSAERQQAGQQYTVRSLVSNADKISLRGEDTSYPAWVTNRYLQLPRSLPDRVLQKAHEIVAQAGATNPYDMAVAIEEYLRQYKYNTHISAAPSGRDVVDYFLFESKEGYCVYYSSAMVVMLRALGIPAREATGFSSGEYDTTTGEWTVRESASHAWPEVYFPNAGWVRFEPTPSQAIVDRPESREAALASPTPYAPPTPVAPPTRFRENDPDVSPTPPGGGAAIAAPDGGGSGFGLLLMLAAGLAVGLVLLRIELERRAVASGRLILGGIQYYDRLIRLAWWVGLRPRPQDTPYEFAQQVSREVPGTDEYVQPIARAYVHERFGQHRPDRGEQRALAVAWMQLRNRLLRRMSEARQWWQHR